MKYLFSTILLVLLKIASYGIDDEAAFSIKINNESSVIIHVRFIDSFYTVQPHKSFELKRKLNQNDLPAYLTLSSSSNISGLISPGDIYKSIRLYTGTFAERQILISSNKSILFQSSPSEKRMEFYESHINHKPFEQFTDSVLNGKWDDIVNADIVYLYLCKEKISIDKIQSYFNRLTPQLRTSFTGKNINKYIQGRQNLNVGNHINNFTLVDSNGKKISLYDLKNEFILIDFWFSSCGPCIAAFPEMLNLYDKTERKKFQIIGISVDSQKNLEAWKNSVKSNNLSWVNLIDSDFSISFNTYAITIYPTTILLNKDHQIVKINPSLSEIKNIIK